MSAGVEPISAVPPSGRAVRIVEVAPRDGLQHEAAVVPTETKVALIDALSGSGVAEIEAGSFVSPRAIPQLADSDAVFRKIARHPAVTYSALVPNERGLERACAAGVQKVAVFTAASDAFARRNIHASIAESLARFRPVVAGARRAGMAVRGYISTVVFCPYEGRIAPDQVDRVAAQLLDLGVDELSLGETLGRAAPADIRRLLDRLVPSVGATRLALHCHDTYGLALANVLTAWSEYGLTVFDSSAGGLGGCPYAPGASGNVATEDVVFALKASGAVVGVDERVVVDAIRPLGRWLGRPFASRLARVLGRGEDDDERVSR